MGQTEEELIEEIRTLFDRADVPVGIGDDAAVFRVDGDVVVTTDMLVEEVDFTSDARYDLLAVKSLAANLSDLAAMGATPNVFLLSLAFPPERSSDVRTFVRSLAEEARRSRVSLIGGDLSASAKFVVSIVAFGTPNGRLLLRSAARAGDRIFVSRPLGGSAAGLSLVGRGWKLDERMRAVAPVNLPTGYAELELAAAAMRHHLAPQAESSLGPLLSTIDQVHACIDISDGLSTDLWRILKASAVGAEIEWERLPLFPHLETSGRKLGIDVESCALHGGEEYALLFTSTLRESELSAKLGRPVYAIGRVDASGELALVRNGARVPLRAAGWDHFSRASGPSTT